MSDDVPEYLARAALAGMPIEDVQEITSRIINEGILLPGYEPVTGLLDITTHREAQIRHGIEFHIFADRNLITRIAYVAQKGAPPLADRNTTTKRAIDIAAAAQALDIQIEPSISYYEMAATVGLSRALEELSWFRAADHGQAFDWIEIAQGRATQLSYRTPRAKENVDLLMPLKRWLVSYISILKVAELARTKQDPLKSAIELLRWMRQRFSIVGAPALYGMFLFAVDQVPGAKCPFKQLHSASRSTVMTRAANIAWDMTYIGQFVAAVNRDPRRKRYLLATADEGLMKIAEATLSLTSGMKAVPHLTHMLEPEWEAVRAARIAKDFTKTLATMKWGKRTHVSHLQLIALKEAAETNFLNGRRI